MEVREARRLLKEKVRTDWEYPTLPAFRSTGRRRKANQDEDRVAGFRFHAPHDHDRRSELPEATEWRERECSTDSDLSDSGSVHSTSSKSSKKSRRSTFKFEGPDSVGAQIVDRRTARKRKRQMDLEEEVSWNEGLAHWMSRRDVWCCARTAAQVRELEHGMHEDQATAGSSTSATSTPRTSTSTSTSSTATDTGAAGSSSPATTPDSLPSYHPSLPPSATAPQHDVLVPVCAPILPNHPIRRKISPSMYNEIYTKIILQSRTPSVPINLLTLIAALIQGWKDDGEWPPKPGVVEPSIAGKRKSRGSHGSEGLKNGVKAVGRVLRLTGT